MRLVPDTACATSESRCSFSVLRRLYNSAWRVYESLRMCMHSLGCYNHASPGQMHLQMTKDALCWG